MTATMPTVASNTPAADPARLTVVVEPDGDWWRWDVRRAGGGKPASRSTGERGLFEDACRIALEDARLFAGLDGSPP